MNSFSKKEVPKEGKQNRQGFSFLSKPWSEGPLGAKTSPKRIENRIFEDLKWFGWEDKFAKICPVRKFDRIYDTMKSLSKV